MTCSNYLIVFIVLIITKIVDLNLRIINFLLWILYFFFIVKFNNSLIITLINFPFYNFQHIILNKDTFATIMWKYTCTISYSDSIVSYSRINNETNKSVKQCMFSIAFRVTALLCLHMYVSDSSSKKEKRNTSVKLISPSNYSL